MMEKLRTALRQIGGGQAALALLAIGAGLNTLAKVADARSGYLDWLNEAADSRVAQLADLDQQIAARAAQLEPADVPEEHAQ